MESNDIFVDTSFIKALLDPRDDFFGKALEIFNKLRLIERKWVTTNFVLDETFTVLRVKSGILTARDFYTRWKSSNYGLKIIRVMAQDESRVWEWFWKPWSKLSYTDCTSFAVMERLGLKEVLTFDDHFTKAGFKKYGSN